MKNLLIPLLGEYELQYTVDGKLVGGLAGLDYAWLFGALIFVVIIYSLFRLVGVLFGK